MKESLAFMPKHNFGDVKFNLVFFLCIYVVYCFHAQQAENDNFRNLVMGQIFRQKVCINQIDIHNIIYQNVKYGNEKKSYITFSLPVSK
jgi:hypothetical protein